MVIDAIEDDLYVGSNAFQWVKKYLKSFEFTTILMVIDRNWRRLVRGIKCFSLS
jgi:hypothetical protein